VGLSRSTVPVPPLRPHPPCLIVALASRPPSGLHNLQSRLFVPHPTPLLAVVGPGPPTAVCPPFLTSVALISYRFPLALGPAHLYLQVCGLWTRACILYRILPCVVCLAFFLRLRRTPFLRIRQSVPSQSRDTLAESHGAFAHRSPVPPPPIERPLRSLVSGSPQPPSFSVSFYPATLLPLPLFLPQSQPTGSPIFSLCHGNMHVSM